MASTAPASCGSCATLLMEADEFHSTVGEEVAPPASRNWRAVARAIDYSSVIGTRKPVSGSTPHRDAPTARCGEVPLGK